MKRLLIFAALLMLASGPVAAETVIISGVLETTDPGENAEAGENFIVCDFPRTR